MLQLLHRCSFYSQPSLRTPLPQSYYYHFLPFLQDLEVRNGYLDRNAQNSQSLLQSAVSRLQLPPGLRFSADPAFDPKVKKENTKTLFDSLSLSLSLTHTRARAFPSSSLTPKLSAAQTSNWGQISQHKPTDNRRKFTTEKPQELRLPVLQLLPSLKTQQPNSKFHHLFTLTLVTDPHNTPSYANVPDFATTLSFFLSLDRERASERASFPFFGVRWCEGQGGCQKLQNRMVINRIDRDQFQTAEWNPDSCTRGLQSNLPIHVRGTRNLYPFKTNLHGVMLYFTL
jgi:hypothetical protein